MLAKRVVQQRKRLPPAINDQALFTKSCPYGDSDDPFYHSPCNKIGSNYSPEAAVAAAILFEEFPRDPHAPRKPGLKTLKLVRDAQDAGVDPCLALKIGSIQVRSDFLIRHACVSGDGAGGSSPKAIRCNGGASALALCALAAQAAWRLTVLPHSP